MPGGKLLGKVFGALTRRQVAAYHRSGGTNRMSKMMDFPVVLLTTKGARSGASHTTPLGGFPDGDDAWLVVGSNAGSAKHPSWFHNMASHPDEIWLEVGPRRLKVRGDSLTGQARLDALQRIAAVSARYGKYQEKTDREIPIVRLIPSD
jgi:deazaflavin-dependent oxidoreductase (nitroreductase family)